MKQAQTASPFQNLSKQAQREKWLVWQSTHMESREIKKDEEFPAKALPPLKYPHDQMADSPYIPRTSQYNAVINRMKKAAENLHELEP